MHTSIYTKRTNILFDPGTWSMLEALSKQRNVSVGELVRQAVIHKYSDTDSMIKLKSTHQQILDIRPAISTKPIDYKELIHADHRI